MGNANAAANAGRRSRWAWRAAGTTAAGCILLLVVMLMDPPPRGQRTRRVHIHAEQQVRVLASSTSGRPLHGSGVGAVKGARSPWKSSGARGGLCRSDDPRRTLLALLFCPLVFTSRIIPSSLFLPRPSLCCCRRRLCCCCRCSAPQPA